MENDEIISVDVLNNKQVKYEESMDNEELFYIWSNKNCEEILNEITFENAEELTDQSLPLLILFHHPNDHQSILLFQNQLEQNLHQICISNSFNPTEFISSLLAHFNCLHADGTKLTHPLKHLGKTINDLPLLLIDTFEQIFVFPDFKQISFE